MLRPQRTAKSIKHTQKIECKREESHQLVQQVIWIHLGMSMQQPFGSMGTPFGAMGMQAYGLPIPGMMPATYPWRPWADPPV